MVGYGPRINTYRVFDPERKCILISSDVVVAPHRTKRVLESPDQRELVFFSIESLHTQQIRPEVATHESSTPPVEVSSHDERIYDRDSRTTPQPLSMSPVPTHSNQSSTEQHDTPTVPMNEETTRAVETPRPGQRSWTIVR